MGERKHFLDWLRVIAFFLLILFHVGLLYVSWGYNLKSERISTDLEYAMNLLSPWRLALLFFISGVASRFLVARLGAGGFAKDRLRRLLPVLLLGMLVINPVQVYVEVLDKGVFEDGYLDFWFGPYLRNGYYPYRMTPAWDHLWFLLYLLVYAMALAAVLSARRAAEARAIGPLWLVVVPGAWLVASDLLVSEVHPATLGFFYDWANHIRWIGVYFAGAICGSQQGFWDLLRVRRRTLALTSAALLIAHLASMALDFGIPWDSIVFNALSGLYGWSVILTLCGYAAEHWNRPSRALSYLNEAILPVYVFHQPVMLVLAYNLFPLRLPVPVEVALLILGTGVGSFLGYEIFARRTRVLRFLFGLRQLPAYPPARTSGDGQPTLTSNPSGPASPTS